MSDILVKGWTMPSCCATCPFFKIVVANAGYEAKIFCRVSNEVFEKQDMDWVGLERSCNCPIEVIE